MRDKDKPTNINVTSHGQSGGVTAGIVNVGQPRRRFTSGDSSEITRVIPKGADVTITATMSSDEALAYAFEIYKWMKANGYPDVKGPNSAMWTQPVLARSSSRMARSSISSSGLLSIQRPRSSHLNGFCHAPTAFSVEGATQRLMSDVP